MKSKHKIFAVVLLLCLTVSLVLPFTASAAVVSHTDVLQDLQKDSSFKISNYPYYTYDYFKAVNSDDNTSNDVQHISVIQVAEGEDGELFVYTYQPLEDYAEICASSIVMSVGFHSANYQKYDLRLVSYNEVFKKYLVEGYTVTNDLERFYNISEIERPFDDAFDEQISDETITDYKSHTVGQTWCAYYLDGSLVYEMETLEVVEIKPTLTDFVYLGDGFTLSNLVGLDTACYAHYIAFDVTNYKVDKIIDATITYKIIDSKYSETIYYTLNIESSRTSSTVYKTQSGEWVENPSSSDWTTKTFEITEEQTMHYQGRGLLAKKYSWDRIMSANNFVTEFESQGGVWNTSAKETLLNSQFVFSFTESKVTEYDPAPITSDDGKWVMSDFYSREGTKVAQVDILRLHFMSEGKTYNLGVVGDTTTADDIPGGVADELADPDEYFGDFLQLLLLMVIGVAACVAVVVLKPLWIAIFHGVSSMFELVGATVSLPFKLIASKFDNKKRK